MQHQTRSRCFQDMQVWKKAHAWVVAIYRFTEKWPRHETYGLTSQLRRAAASVPLNLVEGFRRRTKGDKVRYYNVAQAPLDESEYCLILARDLNYGDPRGLLASAEEIARMLDAYTKSMLRPFEYRVPVR